MRLALALLLASSSARALSPGNPLNLVMTPDMARSPQGKQFSATRGKEMERVAAAVQGSYNSAIAHIIVDKNPFGIGLWKQASESAVFYFGGAVAVGDLYNGQLTSFDERAVQSMSRHGKKLIKLLSSEKSLLSPSYVAGIRLGLVWYINRPLVSEGDVSLDGAQGEGINIYAKTADCLAFASSRISLQEFLRRARVIGWRDGRDTGPVKLSWKDRS